MTTAEALKLTASLAADIAAVLSRWGRVLWGILSFSVADDRIAPRRSVSVLLEEGGLAVVYGSRFLSRLKIR